MEPRTPRTFPCHAFQALMWAYCSLGLLGGVYSARFASNIVRLLSGANLTGQNQNPSVGLHQARKGHRAPATLFDSLWLTAFFQVGIKSR